MKKPFNALFDKLPENISKNDLAKSIVGLRDLKGAIPIDQPCELGYVCPVCEYEPIVYGSFDERLHWSEYNSFLWCAVCNRDYPSAFCCADLDKAIDVFLSTIKDASNSRLSDLQAVADKLAERLKAFRGWQTIESDKEEITLSPKDLFDARDAEALSAYEKLMEQK